MPRVRVLTTCSIANLGLPQSGLPTTFAGPRHEARQNQAHQIVHTHLASLPRGFCLRTARHPQASRPPLGRGCSKQQRSDAWAEAAEHRVEATGAAGGASIQQLAAGRVEGGLGSNGAGLRARSMVCTLCRRRPRHDMYNALQRQDASIILY
jgi:hypothetical protein